MAFGISSGKQIFFIHIYGYKKDKHSNEDTFGFFTYIMCDILNGFCVWLGTNQVGEWAFEQRGQVPGIQIGSTTLQLRWRRGQRWVGRFKSPHDHI